MISAKVWRIFHYQKRTNGSWWASGTAKRDCLIPEGSFKENEKGLGGNGSRLCSWTEERMLGKMTRNKDSGYLPQGKFGPVEGLLGVRIGCVFCFRRLLVAVLFLRTRTRTKKCSMAQRKDFFPWILQRSQSSVLLVLNARKIEFLCNSSCFKIEPTGRYICVPLKKVEENMK